MHLAEQARPGESAFDKVVTENAVVRKTGAGGTLEGVHVVDALADEGPLAEQVLVHVGHASGIGVDARFATEQFGIGRQFGAGQSHTHQGLKNAVARDHALPGGIVHRMVEGVGHSPDEFARGVSGEHGVRVQGDDVAHGRPGHTLGIGRRPARQQQKAVAVLAAQQAVELGQFAALALVSHPHPFAFVPQAGAVTQEKAFAALARPGFVEGVDTLPGAVEQSLIEGGRFLRSVRKVGEQAELQAFIPVGEIQDFQLFQQFVHLGHGPDHGGHDHHGPAGRRYAAAEVQTGQKGGRGQSGGQPVDDLLGRLAHGQEKGETGRNK